MKIAISYKNGGMFRKISDFLPFLEVLKNYPFPKPAHYSYTNSKLKWLNRKFISFTDATFLKHLAPVKRDSSMHMVIIDNASDAHLNIAIAQKLDSTLVLLNLLPFVTLSQIKQLFIDIVHAGQLLDNGWCGSSIVPIMEKHFPNENGYTITMLTWLQYFGKEEVEKRGGFAAFESNPYVQTQRIHDGLLVQVGESPEVFDTLEGEQLLVNAINVLPLLKS